MKAQERAPEAASARASAPGPFEAARGRLPRLVIDNPLLDSELPESLPTEEHVAEVKKLVDTAQRELHRAKEKYRRDNTERENAKRRDEHYFNGDDICTLKLCESPDVERRAHVGQLIRYRGGDAQDFDAETAESPAFGAAAE